MKIPGKNNNWNEIEIKDNWSILEGKYDGYPIIVNKNSGIDNIIGHEQLIYRIGFTVPLLEPNENKLPNMSELSVLYQIEDFIIEELKANTILTLIITTRGMREFVFYGDDSDKIKKWYENDHQILFGHEIQFAIDVDKTWEIYKKF